MSHVDLDPDAVGDAGRRTARTATTWEGWASDSEAALRNAAAEVRDGVLGSAVESYLSSLNPAMKSVAKSVDALGANTESASHSVANSDTVANALLSRHGQTADGHGTLLRRPINP